MHRGAIQLRVHPTLLSDKELCMHLYYKAKVFQYFLCVLTQSHSGEVCHNSGSR